MKILKFQKYFIKENYHHDKKNQIISQLQKSLDDLNTIENMEDEDLKDMIYGMKDLDLPVTLKKYMINSPKLMMNDEFKIEYKNILIYLINRLNNDQNIKIEDYENDEKIRNKYINLSNLMLKILNINKEELEELTNKFIIGSKKYQDLKNNSIKHTSEDPFGEENWDDTSEEDRLKKSFEI